MKRIFFAVVLTCMHCAGFSQETKVIDSLKKVEPFDYSERPDTRHRRDSFITIDTRKLLIVIDGKIYSANAPEYTSLKKTDILSVRNIKDHSSITGIEQIILINTKRKKK